MKLVAGATNPPTFAVRLRSELEFQRRLVFSMLSILKTETILDAVRGNPNEFDARVPEVISSKVLHSVGYLPHG